jgi:hypothetical protein
MTIQLPERKPVHIATEHIGAGPPDDRPVRFIVKWTVYEASADALAFEAPYTSERPGGPLILVPNVDGEEPLVDADIRWDGCANWGMSTKGLALHTCGTGDVQAIAELLVYLHRRAGELIPMAEKPWR